MNDVIEPLTRQEFKEWIIALRSGDYAQGQGALCEYGKYCCLGVLAKIKNRLKSVAEINPNNTNTLYFEYKPGIFGSCGYLRGGGEVHEYEDEDDYYFISDDDQRRLIELNDTGSTFNEIADYIEENYLGEEK